MGDDHSYAGYNAFLAAVQQPRGGLTKFEAPKPEESFRNLTNLAFADSVRSGHTSGHVSPEKQSPEKQSPEKQKARQSSASSSSSTGPAAGLVSALGGLAARVLFGGDSTSSILLEPVVFYWTSSQELIVANLGAHCVGGHPPVVDFNGDILRVFGSDPAEAIKSSCGSEQDHPLPLVEVRIFFETAWERLGDAAYALKWSRKSGKLRVLWHEIEETPSEDSALAKVSG